MAKRCDSRVEEALCGAASDVERTGRGMWRFSLVNGAVVPARARVASGWLELTTALSGAARLDSDPLSWLRLNARFGGSVRAACALGAPDLHLRTDLHIEEETSLFDRVGSACEQVCEALHLLQPGAAEMPATPQAGRDDDRRDSSSVAGDIERLCAEAGWPCTIRAASDMRIDIETRAGVFGARLESASGRADHVIVELGDLSGQSKTSQRAVGVFLLALSSTVRAVKGAVLERDGVEVAALASPLEGPTVQALDRALSALAVACQLSGREVQALRDERLASDYLALWDAAPQNDLHRAESHTTEEEHTCLQQL